METSQRFMEVTTPKAVAAVASAKTAVTRVMGKDGRVSGELLPGLLRRANFTPEEHGGENAFYTRGHAHISVPRKILGNPAESIRVTALLMLIRASTRPKVREETRPEWQVLEDKSQIAVQRLESNGTAQVRPDHQKPKYNNRHPISRRL